MTTPRCPPSSCPCSPGLRSGLDPSVRRPLGRASGAVVQGTPVASASAKAAEPPLASVSGTIIETVDAAGYTYMKLRTRRRGLGGGEPDVVKTGDTVTVTDGLLRKASRAGPEAEVRPHSISVACPLQARRSRPARHGSSGQLPAEMLAALAAQHAGAATAAAPKGDVKIPRAEGPDGRSIAEVYASKTALKDKPVVVRGTVVKFNPGIMGRNWVHIRDAPARPRRRTTTSPSRPRTRSR